MITVANNNYKVVLQSKVKYIWPGIGIGVLPRATVVDIWDTNYSKNNIDLTTTTK